MIKIIKEVSLADVLYIMGYDYKVNSDGYFEFEKCKQFNLAYKALSTTINAHRKLKLNEDGELC